MATHSTVLAWRIPGTGEPGGLPSRGSHRWASQMVQWQKYKPANVGHVDLIPGFEILLGRKWQPSSVEKTLLPGKFRGQRSLVGCRLWGHTELDTTEATQQQQCPYNILYLCKMQSFHHSRQFLCASLKSVPNLPSFLLNPAYSLGSNTATKLFFVTLDQLYLFQNFM